MAGFQRNQHQETNYSLQEHASRTYFLVNSLKLLNETASLNMSGEYPISLDPDMKYFHCHDTQSWSNVLKTQDVF